MTTGNTNQNLVKFGRVVFALCNCDKQTDTYSTPFHYLGYILFLDTLRLFDECKYA